jgi:muramoyltetrapeptide carboxypeptidase
MREGYVRGASLTSERASAPEGEESMKIAIVAPGVRIEPQMAETVQALAAKAYGAAAPELYFHPQCYLSAGHFAGEDNARCAALVEVANDPAFDAVWFARGGYGACRIAEAAIAALGPAARRKTYLGYSDAGALLGGLYRAGFTRVAHGPMPVEVIREGGDACVLRALRFLVERAPDTLEPSIGPDTPNAAFNIMILGHILGTPLEPDLTGHVLMLEEVGEYLYRIDRALYHITSNANVRAVAGIRLGRCSAVPKNDPDFSATEEEVIQYWCRRAAIPYLGRADIGHDIDNKIAPFGRWPG